MALILKTIRYKGLPSGQEISAQFEASGGTIGRAPNNHLVLPDPEKFISRLHATIVCEGGLYFIQDSSTGGTYLDNNDLPLQQARAQLHDGQKLRIGEYELQVSLSQSASAPAFAAPDMPVRQLEMAESRILSEPFAAPKPVAPAADEFFASFIEQPESAPVHESFIPPQVVAPAVSAPVDDLDFADLLSKLEELPGSGQAASAKPQTLDLPALPDDFFADEPPVSAPTATQAPTAVAGGVAASTETSAWADFPAPASEDIDNPFDPFGTLQPIASEPVAVSQPAPEPSEETPFVRVPTPAGVSPRSPVEPPREAIPTPDLPPTVTPARPPEPVESQKVSPPVAEVADDRLLREFLAGAGIHDPRLLAPEQWPVLMRTSGELLRAMVEGLMQVLRARAELKSQFRVSVTTMRSVDNNPLKFTPNVDDAMRLILAPTNPGFLPPKQAVKEGFNDIMNHQIAMTAGIQSALADVLRGFDPQLIEKSQGEGVLFQKKAKCWDYYVEHYPQWKAAAQDEFFGDAFADAYEKQMLLLSRAVPKN